MFIRVLPFVLLTLAARAEDSVVVFHEVMFHPLAEDSAAEQKREFIELRNQFAVDVDLAGWEIAGGVNFTFPDTAIIPAGSYLVIAGSPADLGVASALGPWTGRLSNGGETITLRDRNGREMDTLTYADGENWPAAADGAGASLSKLGPHLPSRLANSWRASRGVGGTPGADNLTPEFSALVLNEITTGFAECVNLGSSSVDLAGWKILRVNAESSATTALPATPLAAKSFVYIPLASSSGDRLVLISPDGTLGDSLRVRATPRARHPDGAGNWFRPSAPTPGAANAVARREEIVIHEIMFRPPAPPLPADAVPGQWIELHNKSAQAVDLSGWRISGGIGFDFPLGTSLAAGGYLVIAEQPAALAPLKALGPWSGNLSRGDDSIALEDAAGNLADEVHYYSGGRWPEAADGGGSSLELRDPQADNSAAEAWAASDETAKAPWQTFTWRGPFVASQTGEPTLWREIDLGLFDGPGECLIDDVRVTDMETKVDVIQNGGFNEGAAHWRFLGTHRHSRVEAEPGNLGNQVLRLVATGACEYGGNQIESTYFENKALTQGREYEISLRARWLSGGGRLNTRLYFNRIAKTNLLAVVANGGTPGAANSRAVSNIGPTYRNLRHEPTVPEAEQPVTVSVTASDPDGLGALFLKYSVAGGEWQSLPMTAEAGRYSASVPGRPAAALVQFYVEGTDGKGAASFFPALGPNARAMYVVQDGKGRPPLRPVRLVMTPADGAYLHTPLNTLSNEYLRCTVIADEREIFYDVGVRLKGSFVGRNVTRVGFTLRFHGDRLFRGVHAKVAVDRSQHTALSQGEIIAKHIAARAGGIPCMYDDLARFIHPTGNYSATCQLRLGGFEDVYLDSQYPRGGQGNMFEVEVHRWNLLSVGRNPENPKQPGNESGGTGFTNLELRDWGNNPEAYRWNWLKVNHRDADDFSSAMATAKLFGLTGATFEARSKEVLDVDQWLRTMAYQILVGPADCVYTGSNIHNFRVYTRPTDGKTLYMPWDWDSSYQLSPSASLYGTGNMAKLVTVTPHNRRTYLAHVHDIVRSTFNSAYMTRWVQHYAAVTKENYASIQSYINNRSQRVLALLPTAEPFAATAGAVDANGAVALSGTGPIAFWQLDVNGSRYAPTWTSNTAWTLLVPLPPGASTLQLSGVDMRGTPVTGATASLAVENPQVSTWPALRIHEWMADNETLADPADGDTDDWLEIHNPTAAAVDLAGWKLTTSPGQTSRYHLLPAASVPAGGYLLVWADGESVQSSSASPHLGFKLSNGEAIGLYAPDNREIDLVTITSAKADRSQGRFPDGSGVGDLSLPSPGSANVRAVLRAQRLGNLAMIEASATPGISYQLEASANLRDWASVGAARVAADSILRWEVDANATARFYRLRLAKP